MVRSLPRLPPRPKEAHKGTCGRVLVVAGSWGMAGAAALTIQGAYRAGAGLVTGALPDRIYPIVAVLVPHAVFDPYPGDRLHPAAAERIADRARSCDAVAIGPGLGRDPATAAALGDLLALLELPGVLDADALNLLGSARPRAPAVLTPHAGEAARLLGRPVADRQDDAMELARRMGAVVLLKGPGTVVADGARVYINRSGNAGLATAGTGDVLTGVIAALLAQGLPPFEAACLGAYLHGHAGDMAMRRTGVRAMTAPDLLDTLATVVRQFERTGRKS